MERERFKKKNKQNKTKQKTRKLSLAEEPQLLRRLRQEGHLSPGV
jgi:hypothetical protein